MSSTSHPIKLLYFGTPDLAVPPLQALLANKQYEIIAVVSQPDAPQGRGKKLSPSPLKKFALEQGLKVLTPSTLKGLQVEGDRKLCSTNEGSRELAELLNAEPEIAAFIVVAYGKLIPKVLLNFPPGGILNLHLSLLPALRGAAPIQRAILEGAKLSGVSLMKIDQGLDTGPVYKQAEVEILEEDNTASLTEKLIAAGIPLLIENLPSILDGTLTARAQDNSLATYAEKLEKSDFRIKWEESAEQTLNRIRAASPHPGAFCEFSNESGDREPLKIFSAKVINFNQVTNAVPGEIIEINSEELIVASGTKALSLLELQLAGRKRLAVSEFLRGCKFKRGTRFL